MSSGLAAYAVPHVAHVVEAASSSPWAFFSYFLDNRARTLDWLWAHTWLSVVPVLVGLLLALPLHRLAVGLRQRSLVGIVHLPVKPRQVGVGADRLLDRAAC